MDEAERCASHTASLCAFIIRARRVAAHSLASDREALRALAEGTTTVLFDPVQRTARIRQEYPPEEVIESAAARVRPLLLEREATFHGRAFAALRYFARPKTDVPPPLLTGIEALRGAWRDIKPDGTDLRGYSLELGHVDSTESARATDNVLGFAFVYGDVVHHDQIRLAATAGFGVVERYRAAVPLVAHILMITIGTLNVVREMHRVGLLPPEVNEAFEIEVVAAETVFENEASVYAADLVPGRPAPVPPPLNESPSGPWMNVVDQLFPIPDDTSPSA